MLIHSGNDSKSICTMKYLSVKALPASKLLLYLKFTVAINLNLFAANTMHGLKKDQWSETDTQTGAILLLSIFDQKSIREHQ